MRISNVEKTRKRKKRDFEKLSETKKSKERAIGEPQVSTIINGEAISLGLVSGISLEGIEVPVDLESSILHTGTFVTGEIRAEDKESISTLKRVKIFDDDEKPLMSSTSIKESVLNIEVTPSIGGVVSESIATTEATNSSTVITVTKRDEKLPTGVSVINEERESFNIQTSIIPLGSCDLWLNGLKTSGTLQEKQNSLSIKPILDKIKTDESPEVKKVVSRGRVIIYKCSILMDDNFMRSHYNEKMGFEGSVRIETLDGVMKLNIPKGYISYEINSTFKIDGYSTVDIEVTALRDFFGKDIEIEIL